jgi:predicted permease
MLQDLRFGLKLLAKERAFTVTALLTLALCIGANSAIFAVIHAVLLDPLHFSEPNQLVTLYNIYPGVGFTGRGANAAPDYPDRKALTNVFESVSMIGGAGYDVGSEGAPVRVPAQAVTPSYFHVLRVSPALGRAFTEEDATYQKDKFAILSYGLWNDLFARDPNVLGKEIRLSGTPYRIVGVMGQSFEAPGSDARVWVPLTFAPEQFSDNARHSNNWRMIARLRPGVTTVLAQQRIDALNHELIDRLPVLRQFIIDSRFQTLVTGMKDEMVEDIRPTLIFLQAAVAFVLLIGCVNVANLLLVRSNIRMKEMAVRFSLGAGRGRLVRQLLTEALTLAVFGGSLGVLTGIGGVRLLAILGSKELPRGADIHVSGAVLGFSAAVAVATGLIFGSVPVYHLFRRDLNAIFRSQERGGTGERRAMWTRSALVVCQVSLAFLLLIGAGLLTMSFLRLLAVRPGFQPEHVLAARFTMPVSRFPDPPRIRSFTSGLMDKMRAVPGVENAGFTTFLPFSGNSNASVAIIDGYVRAPGENPPVPGWNVIDPGYLQTMGIPLLQGRGFTDADTGDSQKVCLIDEFLVRKYWPKGNAIGAGFRQSLDSAAPLWRIVGVVGAVKTLDLSDPKVIGQIYRPLSQLTPRGMHLVVKTSRDSPALAQTLRRELQRADPELALFDVKTMDERIATSMLDRRASMWICLVFAGLALALSAIGIYGVLAYTVTQRTREIGIRLALGAEARDVLNMVIGHGARLAAAGLAIGIVAALALTRLMTKLLFGVKPAEPVVFIVVAAALMAVALFAALIPSLRAIRIRPAVALRYE